MDFGCDICELGYPLSVPQVGLYPCRNNINSAPDINPAQEKRPPPPWQLATLEELYLSSMGPMYAEGFNTPTNGNERYLPKEGEHTHVLESEHVSYTTYASTRRLPLLLPLLSLWGR